MATIEQLRAEPPADTGSEPYEPIPILKRQYETSIGGQEVRITYREPRKASDITDGVPIVIAHGWNAPASAYDPLGKELAMLGKPNAIYEEDPSLGLIGDLNPLNLLRVAKLSSQAAWAATRYMRDEFGHDEVDAYGHSRGGQTVVNLALHKPGHLRALILDGSLGLNKHRLPEMVGHTGHFVIGELLPALGKLAHSHGPKTGMHVVDRIRRHPARALAEGLDAGSANLHDAIERLAFQGIGVSVLHSRNDRYFALHAVERDSRHLFGEHFHIRDDPKSNHLAPQLDPQGTAEVIMHALDLQLSNSSADVDPSGIAA